MATSHIRQSKEFARQRHHRLQTGTVLLIISLVIAMALCFPRVHYSTLNYKVNDITRMPVIAPFDFPILKSDKELIDDRDEALKKVPFVFIQDESVDETEIQDLNRFYEEVNAIRSAKNKLDESRRSEESFAQFESDSSIYRSMIERLESQHKVEKNSSLQKALTADPKTYLTPVLTNQIHQILSDLYSQLIIDIPKQDIVSEKVSIQQKGEELLEETSRVLSLEEAWTKAKRMLNSRYPNDEKTISIGYEIMIRFIKPNLIFQREITDARQKEILGKVPISKGVVLENEKIVDANTRVTPDVFRKFDSLLKERARRSNINGGLRKSLPIIGDPIMFFGQAAMIGIIFSFFLIYMSTYRSAIVHNAKMIGLIGIIFLIQTLLTSIFVGKFNVSEYIVPITFAAITLAILFDSKIAFIGISTLAVIIGAQLGGNINFIITSIFASSLAIYSVRKLRQRSQIFRSMLFIVSAYFVSIAITELLRFSSSKEIFTHLLYAGINGIISPVLAYGTIGLFEGAFGITTDLTLLELADFNHPALKLLSKEATGTFTHCVTVGNLAEAAADTIGANALLARVGAYYHDIGKVTKPDYFIENQSFDLNKHDNLAPNLSALIIINHVKEGLRLAAEFKLPKIVADFIPTHHGTTRVEYFYNKALEQAENPADVNDSDFRYPGPKPHTKETGIVMICETIEAASRSLDKPTIGAIEKVIDMIIDKRLKEGQFDECPLTISDLKHIKGDLKTNTGILPILKGIHHLRIEYPGQENLAKNGKNNSPTARKI
ncbi:MAG: HDIG domain-containing protein [Candidatus Marinimicrobia bacterium]|nr:HDIG domain-containing protein [Candidatus Neomarinimicrobiota bacterium]